MTARRKENNVVQIDDVQNSFSRSGVLNHILEYNIVIRYLYSSQLV